MSTPNPLQRRYIGDLDLPEQVKLVEVGPRDGLQNLSQCLTVQQRTALVNNLIHCGIKNIEIGSLISERKIPQMANSEAVYKKLLATTANKILLLANQRGLQRAIQAEAKYIAVLCAASETFSFKNINCGINANLQWIKSVSAQALEHQITVRAYISCIHECPYEGEITVNKIINIASRLHRYGCDEIVLSDTLGTATAGKIKILLQALSDYIPCSHLAVHFHDTYGQAIANILTALQYGISTIDCSVSGLGGCPYAPGASGNVATEDVVYLLNGLGIKTGINLENLIECSWDISRTLHRLPASKSAMAQPCGNLQTLRKTQEA